MTTGVRLYNEYLMGEEASVPPGFRGRLAGALWGPVHSLREPGTVRVCVRLWVGSVLINRVAAILVSDLKATPLFLFLILVTFLFENP